MSSTQVPSDNAFSANRPGPLTDQDRLPRIATLSLELSTNQASSNAQISGNTDQPRTVAEPQAKQPEETTSSSLIHQGSPAYSTLPLELQSGIWKTLFDEPGINFYDIELCSKSGVKPWYRVSHWYPKLRRVPSDTRNVTDDSLILRHRELATTCTAAAYEWRMMCKSGKMLINKSDGRNFLVGKKSDIVCLKALSNPEKYVHPSAPSWELPRSDIPPAQEAFQGIEKLAIHYRSGKSIFATPPPGRRDRRIGGTACCPAQLVNFIDCCPDIQEFFILFPSRFERNSNLGQRIQKWCDQHDMDDLAIYTGRNIRYYEVHRMSVVTPCNCALSPKCHIPIPLNHGIYALFDEMKRLLLDEDKRWNLSEDQRRNIKFKVLMMSPYDEATSETA